MSDSKTDSTLILNRVNETSTTKTGEIRDSNGKSAKCLVNTFDPNSVTCDVLDVFADDDPGEFLERNNLSRLFVYAAPRDRELIEYYILRGYFKPFMTSKSVLGSGFPEQKICLSISNRKNASNASNASGGTLASLHPIAAAAEASVANILTLEEFDSRLNYISYILHNHENKSGPNCSLHIRLTPGVVRFLQNLLTEHVEKEVSGALKLSAPDSKMIFDVEFDDSNGGLISGHIDSVDVPSSRHSFHLHPHGAYQYHSAKIGFPSSQDYMSFLCIAKEFNVVFHIVVAIEGIYIISLGKYYDENEIALSNDLLEYIKKEYRLSKKTTLAVYFRDFAALQSGRPWRGGGAQPDWYGKELFDVQFRTWEDLFNSEGADLFYINTYKKDPRLQLCNPF
jgi:hypothetical protein